AVFWRVDGGAFAGAHGGALRVLLCAGRGAVFRRSVCKLRREHASAAGDSEQLPRAFRGEFCAGGGAWSGRADSESLRCARRGAASTAVRPVVAGAWIDLGSAQRWLVSRADTVWFRRMSVSQDGARKHHVDLTAGLSAEEIARRLAPKEHASSARVPGATRTEPEVVDKRWALWPQAEAGRDAVADAAALAGHAGFGKNIENFIGTVKVPVGV